MKNAYYFSHDNNARHDPRILLLRSTYGAEGYGWFWMLIEMMDEQGGRLSWAETQMREAYAKQLWIEPRLFEQFVKDCCEKFRDENGFLLRTDGNYLWSESLLRRISERSARSRAGQVGAMAKWQKDGKRDGKCDGKSNDKMMHEMKGNEIKERKEIKESKARPQDQKCVARYMQELRPDLDKQTIWKQANLYWDHQLKVGWKVGKTRETVKDWKASVRTWMTNAVDYGHIAPKPQAEQIYICSACGEKVSWKKRIIHLVECPKAVAMPDVKGGIDALSESMHVKPEKGERKR